MSLESPKINTPFRRAKIQNTDTTTVENMFKTLETAHFWTFQFPSVI
jgi:hypothetical protein